MSNQFAILELMLKHEIQLHAAIKHGEWKVAILHIEAMRGLIPNA